MPHVIANERAMYWAVGTPVVATGLTKVGAAILTGLPLIADADENAFLGAVAGEVVGDSVTLLPEQGEWCEAGTIYAHGDGLVICRQSHARTEHDPADIPALTARMPQGLTGLLASRYMWAHGASMTAQSTNACKRTSRKPTGRHPQSRRYGGQSLSQAPNGKRV